MDIFFFTSNKKITKNKKIKLTAAWPTQKDSGNKKNKYFDRLLFIKNFSLIMLNLDMS